MSFHRVRNKLLIASMPVAFILLLVLPSANAALFEIGALNLSPPPAVGGPGSTNIVAALLAQSGFLYAGIGDPTPTLRPSVAQLSLVPFTHTTTAFCNPTSPVLAGPVFSLATDGSTNLFAGLGSKDVICRFLLGGLFANTVVVRTISTSGTIFTTDPAVSQCAVVGPPAIACAVRALAVSGDDLYAGLDISGAPFRGAVVRMSITAFPGGSTRDAVCATFRDGRVFDMKIIQGFLYVAVREVPPATASQVIRIDLSTCLISGPPLVLSTANGEGQISALAGVGMSPLPPLFAGLATTPGKIVKIDLSTFTKVGTLTLGAGEDLVNALTTEPNVFNVLLAGLGTSPGCVVKINPLPNPPVETARVCFSGPGEDKVRALEQSGTFIFAGLEVSPGMVVKMQDPPEADSGTTETAGGSAVTTSEGAFQTRTLPGATQTVTTVIVVTKSNSSTPVAVPGFPVEAIIAGLVAGAVGLSVLRRRSRSVAE